MPTLAVIDLSSVAQSTGLPLERVATVVALLDAGNTIPFITRYRKDQTGGLDEEQLRQIESRVQRERLLAERKQTILRSIEGQGKLTPELAAAIEAAGSTRVLEDLYLPFKPHKQTLATTARERGLEPLALEILGAEPAAIDLDRRAADFVDPDKKVATVADALLGAGHILAEMCSENADIRGACRKVFERTGKLVSAATVVATEVAAASEPAVVPAVPVEAVPVEAVPVEAGPVEAGPAVAEVVQAVEAAEVSVVAEAVEVAADVPEASSNALAAAGSDATAAAAGSDAATEPTAAAESESAPVPAVAQKKNKKAKKEKKAKPANKDAAEHRAFRDYFHYSESLSKVPPHRVLAINRGEKIRALRVKIECDLEAMHREVERLFAPADHPHADFLRGCGRDALARLIVPSLEREVRRELADRAERHAVEVFARNLRNLFLQPPVKGRRLLAIDPGFKSGCKLVALDEFGAPLDNGVIHLIGKEERRAAAKEKVVELVRQHKLTVIAIGNGTGCRDTEKWVSDLIAEVLSDDGVEYVIVNEAGASVYSTSRPGREEFPEFDATVRGAISIGRRLLDPLSELVKIDPANIGVGMYQHDVKAKHLRDSLDAVVESCVNFVGVDLNTASTALLRYVSGLNQLTAQRVYEHRQTHGPFPNRESLKNVTGIGEGAFVQAAGFLKIVGGDQPLDATWIHPESYAVAGKVLEKLGASPADLANRERTTELAQRTTELDLQALAAELGVGELTLRDIVAQLVRGGRDPRESLPPPIFKRGVLKIDDLAPGMELSGTVLNVVDFGAFVDIGLKDSGLVHVSQLADKFVQDPHQVVSVGDIVKVWVLEVDKQRRRVSLTMIAPGTEKAAPPRRSAPAKSGSDGGGAGGRPPRGRGKDRSAGKPHGAAGRSGAAGKSKKPPERSFRPKPPPKPLVPLTKEMREGKKPLRTFGDLLQFMELKQDQEPEKPKS